MKRIVYLACPLLIIFNSIGMAQVPSEEFFKGLDLLESDAKQAKVEFLTAIEKDSLFSGSYHFLGVIYLYESKTDSAILFFKKSISLNKDNINHTKEMTYVRLIDSYLNRHDFNNSFNIACKAHNEFPENKSIDRGLKDICLWSFYLKYDDLDSSFLSQEVRNEYIVNSIEQEYLIIRRLRIDDYYLVPAGQRLEKQKKINYDVITCNLSSGDKSIEIRFKLNWDLKVYYGGKIPNNIDEVIADIRNPIYERIGAMLIKDPQHDINSEIEHISNE
jgi:hypothetical protein